MTIGFEANTFSLKQGTLTAPTWGCAAFFINYTIAGQ